MNVSGSKSRWNSYRITWTKKPSGTARGKNQSPVREALPTRYRANTVRLRKLILPPTRDKQRLQRTDANDRDIECGRRSESDI